MLRRNRCFSFFGSPKRYEATIDIFGQGPARVKRGAWFLLGCKSFKPWVYTSILEEVILKTVHPLRHVDKHLAFLVPFFFFFFSFFFLGPYLQHMEVPRLGVEWEPQLLAYITGTTMPDLSCVCILHRSSWQQVLNQLMEGGIESESSWLLIGFVTCWATMETPGFPNS